MNVETSPLAIQISWDEKKKRPVASPNPAVIKIGSGSRVIEWTTDDPSIEKFNIHGLEKHKEFKNQKRSADRKTVSIEDICSKAGNWSYTVTATHHSGIMGSHDPKIANEAT